MTVCIATICENGLLPNSQKIIMCANRQISAGINFESGVSKVKSLNDYCYVMMSSDNSLKTDMVVERVKSLIQGEVLKIEEIVKVFSKEYGEIIKEEREREILSKFGLDYKEFSKISKELNPDLLRRISDMLISYSPNFKSNIIVLGLEPEPHIYVIDELGDYTPYDFLGFATVGSGRTLAFPEMTKYEPQHNPSSTLSASLLRTYFAKKVAQRVGGVGPLTDLAILYLSDGKVNLWNATQELIDILEKTLVKVREKEVEILNGAIKDLDKIFAEKVEEKSEIKGDVKEVKTEGSKE